MATRHSRDPAIASTQQRQTGPLPPAPHHCGRCPQDMRRLERGRCLRARWIPPPLRPRLLRRPATASPGDGGPEVAAFCLLRQGSGHVLRGVTSCRSMLAAVRSRLNVTGPRYQPRRSGSPPRVQPSEGGASGVRGATHRPGVSRLRRLVPRLVARGGASSCRSHHRPACSRRSCFAVPSSPRHLPPTHRAASLTTPRPGRPANPTSAGGVLLSAARVGGFAARLRPGSG